jgi:mRNA-degrading endonuclease HigB of HigAB toxin-antitoxin module
MKKLLLIVILCSLILIKFAFSSLLEVDISEDIKSKIIYETQNISFNVVKFSTEFYNTGSISYNARARIFVYNNNKLIFSGWSQEKILMPGDKKTFDIYWYADSPVKYESKLRMYFGNEIVENNKTEFQVNETLKPEDVFEINNFRTYDNYVIFDIKSKKDAKNVIIIPYKYVSGWIFEQKTIENIKKDSIKTIKIPYYPTVWKPSNITLAIVAETGRYYSEKTLEMKKEEGILKIIYNILDSLKLLII